MLIIPLSYAEVVIQSNTGSGYVAINTSNTERLRVDSSGNVGIGTTSPGSYAGTADNLVVDGGNADSGITIATGASYIGNIFFADGTTGNEAYRGLIQYQHSADKLKFGTAGTVDRVVIDSSGNVGIGTTSPGGILHVNANTPDFTKFLFIACKI